MKTDLELLLEHLQNEVDYLKSCMDACVAEWDFDGAKSYRAPLILTRNKLHVAKTLRNPNYDKIMKLEGRISRIEASLTRPISRFEYLDEEIRKKLQDNFKRSWTDILKNDKHRLNELRSMPYHNRIDNDTILELLEDLESEKMNFIELEIKKEKIFLNLTIQGNDATFIFRTAEEIDLNHFLHNHTRRILTKLGFDPETNSKTILNFNQVDNRKILEELAIIYYEVFSLYGDKEINIKIEENPKD